MKKKQQTPVQIHISHSLRGIVSSFITAECSLHIRFYFILSSYFTSDTDKVR